MIHISVRTDENIRILDGVKISVCGHGVLVRFQPHHTSAFAVRLVKIDDDIILIKNHVVGMLQLIIPSDFSAFLIAAIDAFCS